jgi:hypothetical protein
MDELINLVTQRAGIPADKARTAVDTVLGFVKQKLPSQFASQIDNIAAGKPISDIPVGLGEAAKERTGRIFGKE